MNRTQHGSPWIAGRCRRRHGRGFTLIELMITLAILVLLTVVALPSFNNAILGNKLSGYANSFVASAQLARSEAIKRNSAVKMCISTDGTSCVGSGGWQQGWIVFNDRNANGAVDGNETRVHYQQAIGTDFSWTGSVTDITFQSTGLSTSSGNLVLCRQSPVGAQERSFTISTTGRVSVTPTANGTCS